MTNNFGILDLRANNINIELGGVTIGKIKIPSDYVTHDFVPVLGEHYLIAGDKLQNGFVVLIESTSMRPEFAESTGDDSYSKYNRNRIEENSRWALVTDLEVVQRGEGGPLVHFTAIYADGTMRDRTYASSYKWSVLRQVELLPVCENCGEVHVPDPLEALPDLEEMTRRVSSDLFGEEMSFNEFSDRLIDDPNFLDDVVLKTLDKIGASLFGELPTDGLFEGEQPNSDDAVHIPADRPQRPDETDDEYADRLRDEDEIAGEYNASERIKTTQKLADDDALAALRAKLLGESPVVSVSSNEI